MARLRLSPSQRRKAVRGAAILGIMACDAVSAWLAYLPLSILHDVYLQLRFSEAHGETYVEDPGFFAYMGSTLLVMALVPCVVGNLALRKKAGVKRWWPALAAIVIVPLPAIIHYAAYYVCGPGW